jgi:hypothetical protein
MTDRVEQSRSAALARLPGGGVCRRRVSRRAYERALSAEGPHVASAEGEAWWRDQERRHPEIMCAGFRPDGTDSPNGHVCRHGTVDRRSRYDADARCIVREVWDGRARRFVPAGRWRIEGGKWMRIDEEGQT